MLIRLGPIGARALLLLLSPFAALARLRRTEAAPSLASTVSADRAEWPAGLPVVVAVHADWSPIWTKISAGILVRLQAELGDRCGFLSVDGSSREARSAWGVEILPTVLVFAGGAEVARFPNFVEEAKLRELLGAAPAESPAPDG